MKFSEIVAPSIRELFVQKMQGLILSGRLAVGERIPSERDLAEEMKISKSIVHLGIKDLERMGFLKVIPRQGIFIANYAETGTLETLNAILKYNGGSLDKENVASMLEFRLALEGAAFRKFAVNHTEEDIIVLGEIIEKARIASQDSSSIDENELADIIFGFHHYICLKSGNTIFPLVFNAFKEVGIVFWETSIKLYGIEGCITHVERFLEFMKNRDGEGAVQYLSQGFDYYLANTL